MAIERLLDGEAEVLTRKVIEKAIGGDVTALKLCLDRLAPVRKGRSVDITLPEINSAADLAAAGSAVGKALSDGELSPEEASNILATLDGIKRLYETCELEARIAALEQQGA